MARLLIRQAHGGETRLISDGALPYFLNQGYVVLDDLDDQDDTPPLYLSKFEGDLRWVKIEDYLGGGGGGSVVDATTTVKGIVELATTAETTTGTDTVRAVTPAGVKAVADTKAAASHTHLPGSLSVLDYGASTATAIGAAITAAITALPTTGGEVVIPPGDYTLDSTVAIARDDVTIRGLPGARIKPRNSPSGDLAAKGRFFNVHQRDGVTITGITFLPPLSSTGYAVGGGEDGTVRISESTNCAVVGNRFEAPEGTWAILVTGLTAADNLVADNYVSQAGILYTHNGASRTICTQNTVMDSPANAISGIGNGSSEARDCVVSSNRVYRAGRMGIEDWNSIRGTKILNNVIRGSGKDAATIPEGACFGISAVARASLVEGNTVIDSPGYGIELSGNGVRAVNNFMRQEDAALVGTGYGIMVDSGALAGEARGAYIAGNTILRFSLGVMAWHDCGIVVIDGNTIEDFVDRGITCDTQDPQSGIIVTNNYLRIANVLTAGLSRVAISSYSDGKAGARGVVISRNSIFYDAAAGVGANSWEIAIKPGTNNVLIEGNVVHAAGIAPNSSPPKLSTEGDTITGSRVLNNTFLGGAVLSTTGMTSVVNTGNVTVT